MEAKEISGFTYLGTNTYSAGGQSHTVQEYQHQLTAMEFIIVPGKPFLMGSDEYSGEKPVHEVKLSPFLLAKYAVTQKVWQTIMNSTPWTEKEEIRQGEDYPAICVSWQDAKVFCDKTGLRLPSEAQWEYACRAETNTRYFWGDAMAGEYLWYVKNSVFVEEVYAHKVGQKKPNAFGLYDMSGNVFEWCEDSWHENYNDASADGSAWIDDLQWRVCRGGSFMSGDGYCRSTMRMGLASDTDDYYLGFRVCCEIGEADES